LLHHLYVFLFFTRKYKKENGLSQIIFIFYLKNR
jgi:hypothetical protein